MKLKMYYVPAAIVLICLILAGVVRFSYTDAGDKIYDYQFSAGDILPDYLKKNQISSPQDIINQADIIVKAKYSGNRKITTDVFYSRVTVLQVYKGEQSLTKKDLCVIETVHVFPKTMFMPSSGFLVPLQSGDEYIFLLKKMQFDPSRNLNVFQNSQYYPVTQGAFGYYRISSGKQTQIMDEEQKYTVNRLKGIDIFATNQQVLDTYYQYKEQILKTIGA